MQREVVQTARALRVALGRAADRLRLERGRSALAAGRIAHEPQAAAALRDERVAVRQEREAERMRQAAHDDRHPDAVLLGRIERVRLVGHRDGPDAEVGLLLRNRGSARD